MMNPIAMKGHTLSMSQFGNEKLKGGIPLKISLSSYRFNLY